MSKLIFNYSAMNSGKTMDLIRTTYNYEENGLKVLVMKPDCDTKGGNTIVTRAGLTRKIDYLIKKDDNLFNVLKKQISKNSNRNTECVFIDEAQFLNEKQVIDLFIFCNTYDIPVICYGLRTNFKGELFEGSKTLLALADELNEFRSLCKCGKIARFNARSVNDEFTIEGDNVLIDGSINDVKYIPLCSKCFTKNILMKKYIKN